tara:strand:+ start:639 stop:1325 length:687 start_codon:yes stop_codon:yes gene_type:complete
MLSEYLSDHNRSLDTITGSEEDLHNKISKGEHQQQDFKFRIDSSQKIAKTLSAFANTDGGSLLIGVKDNGKIAGIDPQEEFYMIEGAASLYCKPPVEFKTTVYSSEDKLVLEVYIAPSQNKPHKAKESNNTWLAYVRQRDENFLANRVLVAYMNNRSTLPKKNLVEYGVNEKLLFEFLLKHQEISLSKLTRLAGISVQKAERMLVLFLKWEVIGWTASENGIRFHLIE